MRQIEHGASPAKVISMLTADLVNHKNPVVRTTVSRLLAYTVDRMVVSKALSGAKGVTDKLLAAVAKLSQDGSQEARNYAKSTLHRMMIERPEDFERILKRSVTPNTMRNIEKTLEALKNPHQSALNGGGNFKQIILNYLCDWL